LRAADPALGALIDRVGRFDLVAGRAEGHLAALVRAIVYQQLSGKAASTIYGRLRGLFSPDTFPTPREILEVPDETLRAVGLSRQKVGYVRDLCARAADGRLDLDALATSSDDEVLRSVTAVRGFGRWSAEMFLIFHLGRLDVWPIDDLAIRKALAALHGRRREPKRHVLDALGERYRPYRTVAAWYLWRSRDGA
jgi:3-methyladenine DNA glycosylase/8-oxoguanine DNA glycosylase